MRLVVKGFAPNHIYPVSIDNSSSLSGLLPTLEDTAAQVQRYRFAYSRS